MTITQTGLFGRSYLQSPKCNECGDLINGDRYKDVDGETVCAGCLEKLGQTVCWKCKDTFDNADMDENPDGNVWCDDCIADHTFDCAACNNTTWDCEKQVVETCHGSDDICKACADSDTVECSDCNNIVYQNDCHETVGGDDVCESCYADSYGTCDTCGGIVHCDDLYCTDYSTHCEGCRPYDSNFDPSGFRNRSGSMTEIGSTRCFGVELETDECEGYHDLENSGAWGAKNDPTVDGKEFYSDILNGDDGLNAIKEWGALASCNGWDAGSSAGYHLHLDMRNESDDSLYAIAYAYRKTQEVWWSFVESHRHTGCYSHRCRWDCADVDAAVRDARSYYSFVGRGTRYNWCNLAAYGQHTTIENRLHHGTCDGSEVINWVKANTRFCDWASQLGYEGVKESLDGMSNDDMFRLFMRDIWTDYPLCEYYADKARSYDHGFLTESIGCTV
jgi:hypothetical protein